MSRLVQKNLLELISNDHQQYLIPIYQRNYTWSTNDVKTLIDDLIDFGEKSWQDTESKYFVGNIVTRDLPKKSTDEIAQTTIVDGQQRIITTILFVIALYRKDPEKYEKQKKALYLVEKNKNKLKIERLIDKDTLKNIIENNINETDKKTNIYKNFIFIKKYINKEQNAIRIYSALEKTLVANIKLDKENDTKIFQTINSTGKPLEDHDLIKNHIFFNSLKMDNHNEHDLLMKYENISKKITPRELNAFFRQYVTIKSIEKELVSKKRGLIFERFVKLMNELHYSNETYEGVIEILDDIQNIANIWYEMKEKKFYETKYDFFLDVIRKNFITYFSLITDSCLKWDWTKDYIFKKIISLIAKLSILRTMNNSPDKNITRDVFHIMKRFIESKDYKDKTIENLEKYIQETNSNYKMPSIDNVLSIIKDYQIYTNSRAKTMMILKAYELSLSKNSTKIDWGQKWDIEHFMPQKPKSNTDIFKKWSEDMEFRQKYNIKKNTIGNLSLLTHPMNAAHKNNSYYDKLNNTKNNLGISKDRLFMNKDFQEKKEWNFDDIDNRSEKITKSIFEWLNNN